MASTEDNEEPLVFLALPDDVLRRIATCSGASAVVVACASRGAADQRLALRRGVDDFERARFGGRLGLTVREAAQLLRDADRAGGESAADAASGELAGTWRAERPIMRNERPVCPTHGRRHDGARRTVARLRRESQRARTRQRGGFKWALDGDAIALGRALRPRKRPRGCANARGGRRYPRQSQEYRRGAVISAAAYAAGVGVGVAHA